MYIAILGRQPALGMAEIERVHGDVSWFSDQSAVIETDTFDIGRYGGTLKAGRIIAHLPHGDWRRASMKLVQAYAQAWSGFDGKITLGISAYGFDVSAREVQKAGIVLKQKLKQSGVSLRMVPNSEAALNTATSHHNKLGLSNNKVELLVVRARNGKIIIAESSGAQNITAYTKRDQERPKRDAFVGMLPPKLAQMMINLAIGSDYSPTAPEAPLRILDPFCGTGVILQESLLMNFNAYGTDLADKMVSYSQTNLDWLQKSHHVHTSWDLMQGDAMDTKWNDPIDAVVCESYLGQPFSAPPSNSKLTEVRGNCNKIISTFLRNIAPQLQPGTPLCVAIPAWRDGNGEFTHLPLVQELEQLGYELVEFKNVRTKELLYFREDQIVARELLVITKK